MRTVAHPVGDALDLLHEQAHELVVDLVLHDEPRPRDARLARSNEARKRRAVRGRLGVRVVEHNYGCLAAELRRVRGEVLADDAADGPSGLRPCLENVTGSRCISMHLWPGYAP